jgi:hypothetical protein
VNPSQKTPSMAHIESIEQHGLNEAQEQEIP